MTILIKKTIFDEMVSHCRGEYPNEGCGILAGKNGVAEKIYRMQNISDKPQTCYFIKPEEQLRVFKNIRNLCMEMQAIYHSHADVEAYPSKRDIDLAFYPEAVYLIVSFKEFNRPVVRGFRIIEGNITELEVKKI